MPVYRYTTRTLGERWAAVVHHEGRQVWKRGFTSRQAAEKGAALLLASVIKQEHRRRIPAHLTLGAFLMDRWLPTKAPALSANSIDVYRYSITLLGDLLSTRLDQLRPLDLQAWVNHLAQHASPKTVRVRFTVIKQALRQAIKWDLIARNPADAVILPKRRDYEPQLLTVAQIRRLMLAAEHETYGPPITLALLTGLRIGELCALRWSDVDLEGRLLRVNAGKTRDARRGIALGDEALAALRRQQALQREWRLARGPAWRAGDAVFTTARGTALAASYLRWCWRAISARVGLAGLRFHDLRHAHATLLALAGVHPRIAQARMGHSTPTLTMRVYQHIQAGDQVEAAASVERLIRGR